MALSATVASNIAYWEVGAMLPATDPPLYDCTVHYENGSHKTGAYYASTLLSEGVIHLLRRPSTSGIGAASDRVEDDQCQVIRVGSARPQTSPTVYDCEIVLRSGKVKQGGMYLSTLLDSYNIHLLRRSSIQ